MVWMTASMRVRERGEITCVSLELWLCDDASVRRSIPFDPSDQCHRYAIGMSSFQTTFYFLFAASVLQLAHALRFSPCIRDHVRAIEIFTAASIYERYISKYGYIDILYGIRIFDQHFWRVLFSRKEIHNRNRYCDNFTYARGPAVINENEITEVVHCEIYIKKKRNIDRTDSCGIRFPLPQTFRNVSETVETSF